MIRYRLKCEKRHEFEGWFASSAAFDRQAKRGEIACPRCGNAKVQKALMTPGIAKGAKRKPRERAEILRKCYELIMRDAERFAKLITLENGKALPDSRGEVAYAAEFFRWYAEEAVRNLGTISMAPASGARIIAQHKPAGINSSFIRLKR